MLSENMVLFAKRGGASPSPVQELSAMIRPSTLDNNPPADDAREEETAVEAKPQGSSLAGLIRRRGPVRYKPSEVSDDLIDTIVAKHLAKTPIDMQLQKHSINLKKAASASAMLEDRECRKLCTPAPKQKTAAQLDNDAPSAVIAETPKVETTPVVAVAPTAEPGAIGFAKKVRRRQLTVRLEMEQFQQLKAIADETDQTYQSLQTQAITKFLADQ